MKVIGQIFSIDFENNIISIKVPNEIIDNNGFVAGEIEIDLKDVLVKNKGC